MAEIKPLTLKKNFSWNLLGSLVYSFSQWLIMVLLAKLGSPEIVGSYALGLAITAPIIMLTNLQLRGVQATDTTNEYIFNDYFGLRIITSFISLIIIIIIIIINDYNFYNLSVILLVGLTKIIDSYSDVVYGNLQQKERMDYIGISRIIKGISTVLIVGLTLFITRNFLVSLIALNISWLLIFFIYDQRKVKLFVKNIIPQFNVKKLKKLVILTLPLGIVLMLGSLNTSIPRIIVEKYLGEVALGYFAAITYLVVAGSMFINAIGQAVTPRLSKLYKDNMLKKYIELLFKLVCIGIFIGIIGTIVVLFLGEFVLKIVYDSSYSEYNNIFILCMIAGIFEFSGSFLGYALTSMRLFKIQPYLGFIWVVVGLFTSLKLVPILGLKGAAIAMIVTSTVQFLLMLIVILITLKKQYNIIQKNY